MGIISKFFEALLDPKAATWSAGVSFNRSNPLPLDKWSVFQSMDEAVAYAESNAVAYPGQVIAVYHNGKMVAYVLSEVAIDEEHSKLGLEPIGVIPTGDGAINVTDDGVISIGVDGVTLEVVDGALTLIGFDAAPEGAQLVKAEDGSLSWVKPDNSVVEELVGDFEDLKEIVGAKAVYNENGELVSEASGLFAELDTKANADDVEAALDLKANAADVEQAIEDVNAEIAKKADAEEVAEELGKKANTEDVYTKEEADAATETIVKEYVAGLDHLERKIVVAYEQIDPAEENADRYIYMVPNDRNGYDEYMVINGSVEKVGDWDIDLSDYATIEYVDKALEDYATTEDVSKSLELKADVQFVQDELAKKVDAEEGYGLISDAEREKLNNIAFIKLLAQMKSQMILIKLYLILMMLLKHQTKRLLIENSLLSHMKMVLQLKRSGIY